MALAVTFDLVNRPDNIVGNKVNRHVTITFDSSYAAGGESFTAADAGLVAIDRVIFEGPAINPDTPDIALLPAYRKATQKIELFESDDAAPFAEIGADDVSAYSVDAIVVGY